MSDQPVRWTPLGNLDKDTEYKLVGKGNYTDALDIIKQDDEGQVSGTIQPTKRNKHAFSLGSVQAQNKKYRVTVDGDATKNHAIRFRSSKNDLNITTGTGPNGEIEFNGTIASLQAQFYASNLPGVFQTTVLGNSMDFELVTYPYYQWYLESTTFNGEDDVQVIVIQEAIPTDLAGPLKDIGSYDLLGDLFVFSTTQDNEPTELDVQIAGVGPISPNPSPPPPNAYTGPLTQLFFNGPHGLQEGQWIRIIDSDAPWLNGIFVVQDVLTPTDVNIVTDTAWGASHPAISVGSPKVFIHPVGIGEIGVAKKNNSTESWTYTRLLRSVEMNLVSTYDLSCDGRIKNNKKTIYFTDDYNKVRSFYYGGQYVEDGAINYILEDNIYVYGAIGNQLSINGGLSPNFISFDLVSIPEQGGQLVSGNHYYTYRFIDQAGNALDWETIIGPVSIYPGNTSTTPAIQLHGGESGNVTSKSVILSLDSIPQGTYSKIEFGHLRNVEGSISGDIFSEEVLNPVQTSISVTHTGFEEDLITFDIAETVGAFLSSKSNIVKAADLCIIDKRLVLGNIEYEDLTDLNDFAKTFKHRLEYEVINGVGDYYAPEYKNYGGYLNPFKIKNQPTFILNETVRVGVEFVFTNGLVTDPFWVDDITIDTSSTNTANPTDNRREVDGGLPNYALNEYSKDSYYGIKVPYIVFSNIDPNYLLNGVSLKDIVSEIRFRFSPITKEVLASGFLILGAEGVQITPQPDGSDILQETNTSVVPYPDWNDRYIEQQFNLAAKSSIVPSGSSEYPRGFNSKRRYAAFYSPEISMGNLDDFDLTAADKLKVFYPIKRIQPYVIDTESVGPFISNLGQVIGTGDGGTNGKRGFDSSTTMMIMHPERNNTIAQDLENSANVRELNIINAEILSAGETVQLGQESFSNSTRERAVGSYNFAYVTTNSSGFWSGAGDTRGIHLSNAKCLAVNTDEDIYPSDSNPNSGQQSGSTYWDDVDNGVYYAQIFRDLGDNKYNENVYETSYTSKSISFDFSKISNVYFELDVFGGEAFSTSVLLRQRFPDFNFIGEVFDNGLFPNIANQYHSFGRQVGCIYMTQSYMNMELVHKDPDDIFPIFPNDYTGQLFAEKRNNWVMSIEATTTDIQGEYIQLYNNEYTPNWSFYTRANYNPIDEEDNIDLPARIAYSEKDMYASKIDFMTDFKPFDIHDLDTTFGEIVSVDNINGELFTLQPRKYQAQYFNSRGQLQGSSEAVEVLIGDGSVLSRDGQTLSSYGTNHITSIIKGSSPGGKDVIYWFNQENGLFMRFGADGTVVLSERSGIRSFAANNTRWTENQYTPALNYGIRSVWDDRFKEAIWTFIGLRDSKGEWGSLPSNQLYAEGDTVTNNTFINYPFDGVPDVYVSLSLHAPIPQSEPGVGNDWETYWRRVDRDDPEYYSVFTLAFNELSNGFSTFYSHLPKTYLKWKNKFLSSHPTERSEIYEHRYGYDKWYEYEGVWKESEPYLEGVVNPFPDQSKKFVAIQSLSDNVPDRIELKTKDHESFLVSADFDPEDDAWRTPIKNDILTSQTGDPNDDTESLIGAYMRVKFKFFNGAYNKLNNLIIKVRQRLRRTQS